MQNPALPVEGPLHGITVLDLSSVILGPMAGQYLGDMGADVIKVEAPEGDVTRAVGPRRSQAMGALFLANNRNKRSVALDLTTADGQAALHRLAAGSDVLLHSIRASAAARIGLAYPALAALNPRLVHCHVRGFQDDGPYGGRPAYDDIVQALSGLAMLQKIAAGEPRYLPSLIADKVSAVHAACAIALALFHRERTGQGGGRWSTRRRARCAWRRTRSRWRPARPAFAACRRAWASTPRRCCASTGSRQKRSSGWRAAGLDRPDSAQGGRHRRSSP